MTTDTLGHAPDMRPLLPTTPPLDVERDANDAIIATAGAVEGFAYLARDAPGIVVSAAEMSV